MMELTEQFAYKYNQIQWTGVGDADVYQLRSGQTKLLHSCPSYTSSRKPHHVTPDMGLGTGHSTKTGELSEKFQTAFEPPLIFGKLYCKFFIIATKPSKVTGPYASSYEGQIV